MPNETAVATMPQNLPVAAFTPRDQFELAAREAKVYSQSTLVPKDYQDNAANCLIALNMAKRIGADPLMTMQNLYVVHGRPGWSGQFLIATFNQCGRFTAMKFEWQGRQGTPDWGCRAYATERATNEKIVGPWVTWKMVDAEGWAGKTGSKWKTIPELMFHYRAAAFLVRTHAPEIAMGLQTSEELHDVIDVTPAGPAATAAIDNLNAAITGKPTAPSLAAAVQTETGIPAVTFAAVMDAINKSDTPELLDVARDIIPAITDGGQRAELDVAERARRKELTK